MLRMLTILFALGLFVLAMAMGGSLAAFLTLEAFLVVMVGGALLSLAIHGLGVFQAYAMALDGANATTTERWNAFVLLRSSRNLFWAVGGAGLLIGLVSMLHHMEDPSQIGPAMALSLLSIFYALGMAQFLCAPLMHRLAIVLAEDEAADASMLADLRNDSGSGPALILVTVLTVGLLMNFVVITAIT